MLWARASSVQIYALFKKGGSTYQISTTRPREQTFANWNVCNAHSTFFDHIHRNACPTAKGSNTLRPSCFITEAYIGPIVDGAAGRHWSKAASAGRKPYIRDGARNGPKTLPMTTSMMAAASSPPAFLVITTLDAMVVGIALTAIMPISIRGSKSPDLTPPAATTIWIRTTFRSDFHRSSYR